VDDPIAARRARIGRLARRGRQAGFGLLLAACVSFAWALVDLSQARVTLVVVCLAAASVLLVPAIIAGYGVRAAEREDRGGR
jgi:hypothetical protein